MGDSAVGTTSSAVDDLAVGTTSFSASPCSNVGLIGNVWLLLLSYGFTFAASKYDFYFCKTVVTKLSVTCSVSQFVNALSSGCWTFLLVASLLMSNFTPLSRSYLLHRSAKLKYLYVAISLLFLQMNFQESGTDPFFSDGTVEKVSLNTTWNCGLTCPVEQFNMRETFPALIGNLPTYAPLSLARPISE